MRLDREPLPEQTPRAVRITKRWLLGRALGLGVSALVDCSPPSRPVPPGCIPPSKTPKDGLVSSIRQLPASIKREWQVRNINDREFPLPHNKGTWRLVFPDTRHRESGRLIFRFNPGAFTPANNPSPDFQFFSGDDLKPLSVKVLMDPALNAPHLVMGGSIHQLVETKPQAIILQSTFDHRVSVPYRLAVDFYHDSEHTLEMIWNKWNLTVVLWDQEAIPSQAIQTDIPDKPTTGIPRLDSLIRQGMLTKDQERQLEQSLDRLRKERCAR